MKLKGPASEGPERNEENIFGNWRKGILCYAVAGSLGSNSSSRRSELCPIVIRKAEHISSELGCFAEISKQRTGYATWFLLVVYGKI